MRGEKTIKGIVGMAALADIVAGGFGITGELQLLFAMLGAVLGVAVIQS